jgi:hypothetical protein
MANKKTEAKTTEKSATKEITFNKYVKYGEASYAAGEKVEINEEDFDALVEAGVIEE